MQHVDNSPIKKKSGAWEQDSYYKIARHYGWALTKVFEGGNVEWAIVLEDDLEVAPDFFDYMSAGAELMKKDKSLWTVTAWNDNGLPHLAKDPKAVYRSDFFAGLGWIMSRRLWEELGPKVRLGCRFHGWRGGIMSRRLWGGAFQGERQGDGACDSGIQDFSDLGLAI